MQDEGDRHQPPDSSGSPTRSRLPWTSPPAEFSVAAACVPRAAGRQSDRGAPRTGLDELSAFVQRAEGEAAVSPTARGAWQSDGWDFAFGFPQTS